MNAYLVIESTPGYLPDADEPADFTEYSDAVAYANELADELEEQGYSTDRSLASRSMRRAATPPLYQDRARRIMIYAS